VELYWALGEIVVVVSRVGCVCLLGVCWVVWSVEDLVPGHLRVGSVLCGEGEGSGWM
jgi:hypothetical protein